MKLYATITNEKGKRQGVGGNEYLDIDISAGNEVITRLTLHRSDDLDGQGSGWGLYNESDDLISYQLDKAKRQKGEYRGCQAQVKESWCGNEATHGDYCKKHAEMFPY